MAFKALSRKWGVIHCRPAYSFEFADPDLAAELGMDRTLVISVAPGTDTPRMAEGFAMLEDFVSVELDGIGGVAELFPNDPDFDIQWNLHNVLPPPMVKDADVDAPAAWAIHTGDEGTVTVAIVDSGVYPHIEFADRMVPGINTNDPTTPATVDDCRNGHGTHVAGIVAARGDNGIGVAGMSWGTLIMPVRVLDGCFGTQLQAANGIIWAVDHGADIINISLQWYPGTKALRDAVNYAHARGALLIAAAGNNHGNTVAFPARFGNCMAVSATNNWDLLYAFSNFGQEIDVAAPGQRIWSTGPSDRYLLGDGTSMAAPHVSGLAALLKSYDPYLTNVELRGIIVSTTDDLGPCGWDNKFGSGRINAHRALLAATGGGPVGIVASVPQNCAVDARQPSDLDGDNATGWQIVDVTFEESVSGLTPADFLVKQVGGTGSPPTVVDVVPTGANTVALYFNRPITVNAWTTVSHEDTATSLRLGYLPGDVDANAVNQTRDIVALIAALNQVSDPPPGSSFDIDRSQEANAIDILRVIDLFNGAGVYQQFDGLSLP